MKRKEAIKGTREGVVQIFNDYHPSTKEIKKFLKEVFPEHSFLKDHPEDKIEIGNKYFRKDPIISSYWQSRKNEFSNLKIINISTITKRKKTKLSQLEKQFSDLAKNVSELRQTLAKDVEVDVEEIQQETIKEEEIDWSVPQLLIGFNDDEKHLGSIIMSNGKHDFNNFEGYVVKIYGGKNNNFFAGQFCDTLGKKFFKKFKGELTIK